MKDIIYKIKKIFNIEMIRSVTNIKNLINKIIYSILIIVIGFFIMRCINDFIGFIMVMVGFIYIFFIMIMNFVNIIINNRDMFTIILSAMVIFFCVLNLGGYVITEVIPKVYPNNINETTNLFTNSFTSVIGAMVGIIGAVYGGQKTMQSVEKQMNIQYQKELERIEKEKAITIRIIVKLLENEILYNYGMLKNSGIFNLLKGSRKKGVFIEGISYEFRFEVYNNVKYDLLKYPGENVIEDVVDIYEMIYILSRYTDLGDLSDREFNKVLILEEKITKLLELIHSGEYNKI